MGLENKELKSLGIPLEIHVYNIVLKAWTAIEKVYIDMCEMGITMNKITLMEDSCLPQSDSGEFLHSTDVVEHCFGGVGRLVFLLHAILL